MTDTDGNGASRPVSSPRRCIGTTKRGTRCRRLADYGSDFCQWHTGMDPAALPAWDAEACTLVDLCTDAASVVVLDPHVVAQELSGWFRQRRLEGLEGLRAWLVAYLGHAPSAPWLPPPRRQPPGWQVHERGRAFVNRWGEWGRAAEPGKAADLARRVPTLAEARHIDRAFVEILAGWVAAVVDLLQPADKA